MRHYRWRLFMALLVLVPAGFFSKFYSGPGADWSNDYLGGVFYVMFWSFLLALFRPAWKPFFIAVGVLLMTCLLEFLQLWHPHFLEVIRSTFIGKTLLGHAFVWADFPYYFIGAGLAWFLLHRWYCSPNK